MIPEYDHKHFYAISVHSYMIPEHFYAILSTFIRSWILLYDPENSFFEHILVITKQHSGWHTFFSLPNASLYSLMVKIGDYRCMGLLKRWFKTSEKPWKVHSKWNSTLNRDLKVEPVTTADGWFKTSERPWKVHSKWNSTLNRDLNVEPVTPADGWFKTSERPWKVHSKWYTEP